MQHAGLIQAWRWFIICCLWADGSTWHDGVKWAHLVVHCLHRSEKQFDPWKYLKQDSQFPLFQGNIIADWVNETFGVWRIFWEEVSVTDSLSLGKSDNFISAEVLMDLVPLEWLCGKINIVQARFLLFKWHGEQIIAHIQWHNTLEEPSEKQW